MRSSLILLVLSILLATGLSPSVKAAALRTANIGDHLGVLTAGLVKTQGSVVTVCGLHGVTADYTVPGRVPGEEQASVIVIELDGRARVAATYDEQDLDKTTAIYVADVGGVIRYAAPFDDDHPVDTSKICPILTGKAI